MKTGDNVVVLMVLIFCTFFVAGCIRDKAAERDMNIIQQNVRQINDQSMPADMALSQSKVPVYTSTNQLVTVELLNKGQVQKNTTQYYDYLPVELKINNITNKPLEYIRAKIFFKNQQNHMIGYTTIESKQLIPPLSSVKWSGEYVMSAKSEHQTFIKMNPKDIKADTNLFEYKYENEPSQTITVW